MVKGYYLGDFVKWDRLGNAIVSQGVGFQGDLGAGTSGASSGMIHGGIRYMETDRDVTRLSCLDSGYIQAIAPHLLFRIPFVFPILAWTPAARRMLKSLPRGPSLPARHSSI